MRTGNCRGHHCVLRSRREELLMMTVIILLLIFLHFHFGSAAATTTPAADNITVLHHIVIIVLTGKMLVLCVDFNFKNFIGGGGDNRFCERRALKNTISYNREQLKIQTRRGAPAHGPAADDCRMRNEGRQSRPKRQIDRQTDRH